MAFFGYKISGVKNIAKKFQMLEKEMKAGQIDAVREAVLLIHETAVKSIQDNGDGKSQIRYNPRRIVNVSNPGDPPNTDTGRLVSSIKFDFKDGGLIGRVGTNLKYGAWLEFGTEKMAARPWLAPAVQEVSKEIADIFAKNVKKVIDDLGSD